MQHFDKPEECAAAVEREVQRIGVSAAYEIWKQRGADELQRLCIACGRFKYQVERCNLFRALPDRNHRE